MKEKIAGAGTKRGGGGRKGELGYFISFLERTTEMAGKAMEKGP